MRNLWKELVNLFTGREDKKLLAAVKDLQKQMDVIAETNQKAINLLKGER